MKEHDSNQPTNSLTYTEGIKKLSPREVEVLDLVEKWFTNEEIAEHLSLSVHTVRAHRRKICRKLAIMGRNGLQKWLWKSKNEI